MQIVYDGIINKEDGKVISSLAVRCGISFDTARLLYCRKIDTEEKIKAFLNPDKSGFIDPFLLNGVNEAVARILKAAENNENVFIFGDYDADGVCATSVLYYCLKKIGIKARCFVPEREDGYGLNVDNITRFNLDNKIDLLITVDCGISDKDKVEEIKKLGIDVIITDHHEPPEILPDCITINPKIAGQKYQFTELCGTGVAYKLGYAVIGDVADEYLDLVALATVSDSMDLVGENRNIVTEGLKLFNSPNVRYAFKAILGDNDKAITAQTLAYNVAPKINAGGRMGDANCSLQLFLSESNAKTAELAEKLKAYNLNRQVACDEIYKQAKALATATGAVKNPIILVYNKEWKTGFIGIAAARLVEEYSRPAIVFAESSGFLKGSARSVEGINVHDVISSAQDILEAYGGHAQAAGVTVSEENFELLNQRLNDYIKENYTGYNFTKKLHAEWKVETKFSKNFAREIERLGPFGVGNKRPVFATDVLSVKASQLKSGSPHYSFNTDVIEMLDFNGESDVEPLSLPIKKTVLFETNVSVFRNRESVKGFVKNVVAEYDFTALSPYVFANELDKCLLEDLNDVEDYNKCDLGNSTLYVLSDYDNLKAYPNLIDMPVSLYYPESINGSDAIVVSPKVIPDSFDTVVYLDEPISYIKTNIRSCVNKKICGYKLLNKVSVDRSDMTNCYNSIRNLLGREYSNPIDFYYNNGVNIGIYQFIFGIKVFMELGIFTVINGVLRQDVTVKNPLENSKIYNRISTLKA